MAVEVTKLIRPANPRNSNTDSVSQTDRSAVGPQPDNTPATGGTSATGGGGGGSGVTTYSNLTALRAASVPANGTLVHMLGYTTAFDGGGGLFTYQTAASLPDDGGTRIVPSGSSPVVNSAGVIVTPGTSPTVGAWIRFETDGPFSGEETCRNVMWFGAQPDDGGTDNTPPFRLCVASLYYSTGAVYIPSGEYCLKTKWVVDMNIIGGSLSIFGDGVGATSLRYGLTTADTCFIEIANGYGFGSLRNMEMKYVGYLGLAMSQRGLWIHNTTSFIVQNVQMINWKLSKPTAYVNGGAFHFGGSTNTNLTVTACSAMFSFGVSLFWEGGSGLLSTCNFKSSDNSSAGAWASGGTYSIPGTVYTDAGEYYNLRNSITGLTTPPASDPTNWEPVRFNTPCAVINGSNTLKWSNNFFENGGPAKQYRNCAVANSGGGFVITLPLGHHFIAGEYVKLTDSGTASYNTWWKLASVTATSATVATGAAGASTLTCSSLWSSLYVLGLTESEIDYQFFNTGGSPGLGSVGIHCDGWCDATSNVQEFSITNCICDYGASVFFAQGLANADPGSSTKSFTLVNVRPNGGPRDTFGGYRLEGVTTFVIEAPRFFPGNNTPPGVGNTFCSIVISDGGQAQKTQDISITGGSATNKNSSGLYGSATIQAFVIEGANVQYVSIVNVGVDVAKTVLSLGSTATGAATMALNSIQYSNAGRMTLIDSTGTHNL